MEVKEHFGKSTGNKPCSQTVFSAHTEKCLDVPKQWDVLAKYDFTADLESAGCEGIRLSKMERLCVRARVHTFVLYRVQAGRPAGRDVTYS